jgi:hypothetical protein
MTYAKLARNLNKFAVLTSSYNRFMCLNIDLSPI